MVQIIILIYFYKLTFHNQESPSSSSSLSFVNKGVDDSMFGTRNNHVSSNKIAVKEDAKGNAIAVLSLLVTLFYDATAQTQN